MSARTTTSTDLTWRTIDGDAEIAPGIDALFTPGHTPGHMSYRVRMARSGTWLFAVDAIDLAQGIREDRPIGYASDPADDALRRVSHDRLVDAGGGGGRPAGSRPLPGDVAAAGRGRRGTRMSEVR